MGINYNKNILPIYPSLRIINYHYRDKPKFTKNLKKGSIFASILQEEMDSFIHIKGSNGKMYRW